MKHFAKLLAVGFAAAAAACSDGVGVTGGGTFVVAVGQEQFRVRIDNALLAAKARRMMRNQEDQQIVSGELARGNGGFNAGYNWHMKPNSIELADMTIELCDGRPSDIDKDLDYWVDNVKRYCPWGGRFVSEDGR